MRKCPGKTRKMSSVLGTRQMMDLRVRTHASRGGRSLERRVSRSVCVDFFLLRSVWCFTYIFLYILRDSAIYIYICALLLYSFVVS